MAKFKSEAELASKLVVWLRSGGWETYHEVDVYGADGRFDIVAVRAGVVWIIETKNVLNAEVVLQGKKRLPYAHLVSVATPMVVDEWRTATEVFDHYCKYHGVGRLVVNGGGEVFVKFPGRTLRYNRGARGVKVGLLKASLTEDHKVLVPGVKSVKSISQKPGMHWMDACKKSGVGMARRHGDGGRMMLRDKGGGCDVRPCGDGEWRTAVPGECEGFLDWEAV